MHHVSEPAAALSASDYTSLASRDLSAATAYRLLTGIVIPRPIAWISTRNPHNGRVNVAPFSSFNYVAHDPPMLAVNINRNEDGSLKDTARNIEASEEFVVNMPNVAALAQLDASSHPYPFEHSEAELLNIALIPGQHVAAPRIALSYAQMECRLHHRIELGSGVNILYIGEVLAFHLAHTAWDGQRVNGQALHPLSRLGGPFYGAVERL